MIKEQNTSPLRESLNKIEQQTYDMFVKTEGHYPNSMWQLMQYGAIVEGQRREHTKFWGGIFGL